MWGAASSSSSVPTPPSAAPDTPVDDDPRRAEVDFAALPRLLAPTVFHLDSERRQLRVESAHYVAIVDLPSGRVRALVPRGRDATGVHASEPAELAVLARDDLGHFWIEPRHLLRLIARRAGPVQRALLAPVSDAHPRFAPELLRALFAPLPLRVDGGVRGLRHLIWDNPEG